MQKRLYFFEINFAAVLFPLELSPSQAIRKDKDLFISACKFIGLLSEDNEQWENYKRNKASISEAEINSKIDLRNKARADKNYKEADRIRDELFDKGVLIEDKDGKTLWKFK